MILLASSALLLARGASESLAKRFFLHRCLYWSFPECRRAFGWDLDRWLYFGGYPGAAPFADDDVAFRAYVRDSLVEPAIARDVLAMQTVTKPALLRQLFALCGLYSGQIWGRLVENAVGAHLLNHLHGTPYELVLGDCIPTPREETGWSLGPRRIARKHSGTQADLPMVLVSPLMSVVYGMVRQPHW